MENTGDALVAGLLENALRRSGVEPKVGASLLELIDQARSRIGPGGFELFFGFVTEVASVVGKRGTKETRRSPSPTRAKKKQIFRKVESVLVAAGIPEHAERLASEGIKTVPALKRVAKRHLGLTKLGLSGRQADQLRKRLGVTTNVRRKGKKA